MERTKTQSLPSGGSNLLRVTERADMPSWGHTAEELRRGVMVATRKASWESRVGFQQARTVGRAFLAQIDISDNHGPLIVHPGLSAAGVSFPP